MTRRGRSAAASGVAAAVLVLTSLAPAAAATGPTQCDPAVPQSVAQAPTALTTLAAERAWRTATGAGVLVAVVDSGVDARNAHLGDAVAAGVDLVGSDPDPSGRSDTDGHGTAVAGQIAARAVEGSGVVGLAPGARVLPVRVYYGTSDRDVADGVGPDPVRLAAGIRAAVERGAKVVNVSMSTPLDHPELRAAVAEATAAGALVVASAGNRATSTDPADGLRYPAAYPDVLGVASVGDTGVASQDAIHGEHVDVAAPGENVLTTYHAAGDCVLGGSVSSSFATAYVSAAAALLVERYPDEGPREWAYRLQVTAARLAPDERDDQVGWGVIRPDQALAFVDDGTARGPVSPTHPRPEVARPAAQVLDTAPVADPWAGVRAQAAWWAGAGVTGLLAALLLGRLVGRRPRR